MTQEAKKLKITLKRSLIGVTEAHKRIIWGLGISKMNQSVTHNDVPTIRGMIRKVVHLVNVE